ncbi:uncharacterized protein Dwil_GK25770 [Drosophila willistoni]|uniref:CH-like domain-containing protein n=1 Tax=Drosophila willistoni TaxID=7260 RepID=B4N3M1_DROWI|nr:uncharacterized protein LOC6645450 [Drosophila willistoni]EDW79226.1 uncharacterized protein Dwil_GK25770 [Drosophila willistoni]
MSTYNLRTLNTKELMEVKEWLKVHNYELNAATRRDFTDVFVVAGLIKNIHNKLINLDNYPHRDGTTNKRENWETFNYKVLRKLRLKHTSSALEKLAKGSVGAIESLFYDIITMGKARQVTSLRQRSQSLKSPSPSSQSQSPSLKSKSCSVGKSCSAHSITNLRRVVTIDVEELIDGEIVKTTKKLVAYDDYLKALRKCQKKDQFISLMDSRIHRLESILRNEPEVSV